jgi:hypothetical protein
MLFPNAFGAPPRLGVLRPLLEIPLKKLTCSMLHIGGSSLQVSKRANAKTGNSRMSLGW